MAPKRGGVKKKKDALSNDAKDGMGNTKTSSKVATRSKPETGTGYKRAVIPTKSPKASDASKPMAFTSNQHDSQSTDTRTPVDHAQREPPYEASFELDVPSESDSSEEGSVVNNLADDRNETDEIWNERVDSIDDSLSDVEPPTIPIPAASQAMKSPILSPTLEDVDLKRSPLVVDPVPVPISKKREIQAPIKEAWNKKQRVTSKQLLVGSSITDQDSITLVRQEMSSLRDTIDDVKTYIDRRNSELKRMFSDNFNELRLLVQHNTGDGKRKKEGSIIADVEIPFFNIVFSDATMQVVIEKCMVGHLMNTTEEYTGMFGRSQKDWRATLSRGAGLALRIMLFAVNLKKKEGKALYDTQVGVKFSEFREGIVLSALNAAKKNSFCLFRTGNGNEVMSLDDLDGVDRMDMNSKKPKLPTWLQGDFIGPEHITAARMKMEETRNKSEIKNTVVEGRAQEVSNELASSAAGQLYRMFTTRLNAARMTSKCTFFEEVGYLFIEWKSFCAISDQGTVKFEWVTSEPSDKVRGINCIPDTIPRFMSTKGNGGDEDSIAAINKQNKALLKSLMDESQDMVLRVEHEVCIRRQAKKNCRNGVKEEPQSESRHEFSESQSESIRSSDVNEEIDYERKEMIYRNINLIDISCRVLSSYGSQIQHRSPASFLCSSKNSLRCVYSVAVLFKKLLEKAINAFDADVFDEELILSKTQVNGMNLRAMLPTPARQKTAVLTKAVNMFPNVYAARCNHAQEEVVNLTSTSAGSGATVDNDYPRVDGRENRNTKVIDIA